MQYFYFIFSSDYSKKSIKSVVEVIGCEQLEDQDQLEEGGTKGELA